MRPALILPLVALGVAGACSGGSAPEADGAGVGPGRSASVAGLIEPATGICRAADLAPDQPGSARDEFERAHGGLHLLAQALARMDRALSARLLVAKHAVEVDLAAIPTSPALAADLGRLRHAVVAGVSRLGASAPGCGEPT